MQNACAVDEDDEDEDGAGFRVKEEIRITASMAEASNQILIKNMEHDESEEPNTYNVCDDDHCVQQDEDIEIGRMVDRISVSSSIGNDCCCTCTSSYARPRPRPLRGNHRLHQGTDSVTPTPSKGRRRDDDDPNSLDQSFSY